MSILKSRFDDLDVPEDKDLFTFLFERVEDYAGTTAIIDDATGQEITYGSLVKAINSLASVFSERELQKGDVVCIFAEKSIVGTAALFALFKLGVIVTPCRPSHTARELAVQLQNSRSKMLVCDKHLLATAEDAAKDSPTTQKILTIGRVDGFEDLETLTQAHSTCTKVPDVKIDPKEDVLAIIYSSGTTGLPKGVLITHHNVVANTVVSSDLRVKFFTTGVLPQTAPPYHIAGLLFISIAFYTKELLVLYDVKSVVHYLQRAKHYKMKSLILLPNQMLELSKISKEEIDGVGLDFSDMMIVTGGSVFSATNTNEILVKTGLKSIGQLYGCTESSFVTIDDADNFCPGSAGLVINNAQIKIVDLSTRKPVGPHESGEICVKGPGVAKGYLNNPTASKDMLEDGWLKMGDIGYYDESGHVYIVDRLKDVIKYKIMQVAPSEIEEVIYTHPSIAKVCVVPVEDDDAGEIPLACVILKEGQTATVEEIIELVEENLADYKHLRGGVKFFKEFPLTGLGKIIRRQLRDMVQDERNKAKMMKT